MRTGLTVILAMCCSAAALPVSSLAQGTQDQPTEAMLEFLSELEPVDEETWQILEHHALQDVTQKKEESSE